jgi:hypothetical protein
MPDSQVAVWRRIYIEILETVLMATLDPDLWKSACRNWRFSPAAP